MVRVLPLLTAAFFVSACAQTVSQAPVSASQSERCRQLAEMRVNSASRAYVRAWAEEQMRAQRCGDAVPAPVAQ